MEDLVGKNGLMQRLFGNIIQQFLEAEMQEHLGRQKYERNLDNEVNYRNGYSKKKIKNSFGEDEINITRDRKAEFEPRIVKKYETICNELDKKVIGLYTRGMSVDDIKAEIDELYGVDISPSMISKITDKVMETALVWQNRPLEPIYPIVYLDAIHFKVREEHQIVSKDSKDSKAFIKNLKSVYQSTNEQIAVKTLESLESVWGNKYPIVIQNWTSNWSNLSTYFDFPPEIRKIIYTTNALEGFNRQLRKFTKVRTSFPTDDSLRKALFLATEQIMNKWTSPHQNWHSVLAQLSIMYTDRFEQYL